MLTLPYVNSSICQLLSKLAPQYANSSVFRLLVVSTPQYVNSCACQLLSSSTLQYVNSSVCQLFSMSTPQCVNFFVCHNFIAPDLLRTVQLHLAVYRILDCWLVFCCQLVLLLFVAGSFVLVAWYTYLGIPTLISCLINWLLAVIDWLDMSRYTLRPCTACRASWIDL